MSQTHTISIDFDESKSKCKTCGEDLWLRDEQGKAMALARMCKCERDHRELPEPYSGEEISAEELYDDGEALVAFLRFHGFWDEAHRPERAGAGVQYDSDWEEDLWDSHVDTDTRIGHFVRDD